MLLENARHTLSEGINAKVTLYKPFVRETRTRSLTELVDDMNFEEIFVINKYNLIFFSYKLQDILILQYTQL